MIFERYVEVDPSATGPVEGLSDLRTATSYEEASELYERTGLRPRYFRDF